METEQVTIPAEYVSGITSRWNNYQNALRGGISVLITTTRNNLQTYALNPCSISLGRDPTPPEGWDWYASATKNDGTVVIDSVTIYPGVVRLSNNTLVLEYPVS